MALDRREVMVGAAAGLAASGLGRAGAAVAAAPASPVLEAKSTAAGRLAYDGTVPGPLLRVRLAEADPEERPGHGAVVGQPASRRRLGL